MKKILFLLLIAVTFTSCEKSEGTKSGTLQKVSYKKFPCPYYSAQIGFESGVSVGGEHKSYSSAQDFCISKSTYDSMESHVGEQVVFHYVDRGYTMCEEPKFITGIHLKK